MRHILFVDDEPRILAGLQRMLHGQRHEWDMVFVPGGEEALAELRSAPFDVIVSDMRMPGMDGATLLGRVREQFPNIVRIVLSGHTELEAALRTVPVAHQFLAKPCEADVLREVVERALNLHRLLKSEVLHRTIGHMGTLPSLPLAYAALTKALVDPDVALQTIAGIVEHDVAMCAKVLQLVNSGFFGLPRRVASVQTAVSYLGINMLKNLMLSVEVFHAFESRGDLAGFSLEVLQRHALLTGNIASRLLAEKRLAEDAFMAGILHDVGKLVLATRLREHFARVLAATRENGRPLHVVERELGSSTHAEIGAYLLGLWGLPYPIVEAVAYHHGPAPEGQSGFDIAAAVRIADQLAHECTAPHDGEPEETIDAEYLGALGVIDELPAWRTMAAEQAGVGCR